MLTRKLIQDSINGWAPMCGLSATPRNFGNGLFTDAGETAFFARQLEDIAVQLYNAKYPDLQGRNIVNVKTDINPAADFHVWRGYDFNASAVETDDYNDDFPAGELTGKETSQRITGLVAGYGYSIMDIRRAQMAGVPLDSMKALLARESMERRLDLAMALGSKNSAANGIYGFYNNPNYVAAIDVSAQNTGAGPTGTFFAASSGTKWDMSAGAGKTPAKIIADLNSARSAIRLNSKGAHDANSVVVDLATDTYFSQTNASIGDSNTFLGISVKQFIMQTCSWIQNWKVWNRGSNVTGAVFTPQGTLPATGTPAGKPVVMVYEDKPENGEFLLPQPFEQFPPQLHNMKFGVGMHMRFGGYIVRRPLAYQLLTKVQG